MPWLQLAYSANSVHQNLLLLSTEQECMRLLFKEVNSKETAQKALEVLEYDRRCRSFSEQHKPYSVELGSAIMEVKVVAYYTMGQELMI